MRSGILTSSAFEVAVGITDGEGQAGGQNIGDDGKTDRALSRLGPVFAKFQAEEAGRGRRRYGGLLGENADRAAFGVPSIEGALGAFENLSPVNIEKGEFQAIVARDIDLVDIGCHRGIGGQQRVSRSDAANHELELVRAAPAFVQRDAWGDLHEVGGADDIALLYLVARIGADGRRHALNVFGPLAGGDNDL